MCADAPFVFASDISRPLVGLNVLIQSESFEVTKSKNMAPLPRRCLLQCVEVDRVLDDPHRHCQRGLAISWLCLDGRQHFVRIIFDRFQTVGQNFHQTLDLLHTTSI